MSELSVSPARYLDQDLEDMALPSTDNSDKL